MVMVHGDDQGIILPPRIAYNKAVIIPILFEDSKKEVLKTAVNIKKSLASLNPILDDSEEHSPGWKFNNYELKGIPLRIEIGPKDLKKKEVMVVRRDNGKKISVKIKDIKKEIPKFLDEIQKSLFDNAKKSMDSLIINVKSWHELEKAINSKKIAKAPWCNSTNCEKSLKEKLNTVKTILIPLSSDKISDKCALCNSEAKVIALFGKNY